jgi:short subunit dehydrogenase-like uncharacterized protein
VSDEPQRRYDIVLWGATGHTGRRAARYLHEHYGARGLLRWAIAGRNQTALEAVRERIGATGLDILIVPGADARAAEELARSTRVVCTTVAPSALHATQMVEACVRNGTDYCDLSGELHWLRDMMDRHDDAARASGARILNACGFDSIPSDLGVQFLQEQALARFGEHCQHVRNAFECGHIAVSGGSFASGLGVMEAIAGEPRYADLISNPNSLNPRDRMRGAAVPELDHVRFDADFEQYVAPFPLGGINTRIVRRSHALSNFPYGEDFVYEEWKLAGKGALSKPRAQIEAFFGRMFMAGDPNSLMSRLMHRLGPKPGDGPSEEESAKFGPFSFRMIGTTRSGRTLRGYVFSKWDPGHGGTSAMLCDTAWCLAMERERTGRTGGFTTAGVALGPVLREQLREQAGVQFGIGDPPACKSSA